MATELPQDATLTVTVEVEGSTVTLTGKAREFSTGSKGFTVNGKAEGKDGRRYQVSANVILIGSKPQA